METNSAVYKIEFWALSKLVDLVKKYNKKSEKLNMKPLEFHVETKTQKSSVEGKEDQTWLEVTFSGDPAKINGWEFIGTLQHTAGANVLRGIPGRPEIPESFRNVKPHCEHCAKKRSRKDTFVLTNTDSETPVFKQVGRNCLRDFLGHDPSVALALLDMIRELGESREGGGKLLMTPKEVVLWASAIANQIGWSKDNARSVFNHRFPSKEMRKDAAEGRIKLVSPTREDEELADKALAHLETKEPTGFIQNIKATLSMRFLSYKEATLAAWAVGVYIKDMEQEKLVATKAQAGREALLKEKELFEKSQWFGEIGKRMDVDAFLIQSKRIGTTNMGDALFLYKFLTSEGNVAVWITQNKLKIEEGAKACIRLTVKGHKMYNEHKETQVNRVTLRGEG